MPNEKIYAPGHEDGSHGVKLSWFPGQSLTNPDQFNPGSVSIGVGDLTHDGLPQDDEGDGKYRAIFTDLDRDGINRLIRYLRRARNQAYGADE